MGGKSGTGRNLGAEGAVSLFISGLALLGPRAGGARGTRLCKQDASAPCSCWDGKHRQGGAIGFPPCTSFVLFKQLLSQSSHTVQFVVLVSFVVLVVEISFVFLCFCSFLCALLPLH